MLTATRTAARTVSRSMTKRFYAQDTSTAKPTMPGGVKPTAWHHRREAGKEIGPVWAWPATLGVVGAGALYMYSSSGKGKNELSSNMQAPQTGLGHKH
ncbi:uncharacterized protein JCM10292_000225 [Rhodotorula paludigena]|uniref:uncharacterized protein n=1 Tax=Rhodotorula paludigena TaxID=86838 RepID=UPI003170BB90